MIVSVTTGASLRREAAEDGACRPRPACLLADAVDALDADGGRPLALRADRPLAPLAADVRDPVGVPRADRYLLRSACGASGGSDVVTPARP